MANTTNSFFVVPFHNSETTDTLSASAILWDDRMTRNDETDTQRTTYTADDEYDDAISSQSSSITRDSSDSNSFTSTSGGPISLLANDEDNDEKEEPDHYPVPETITIPREMQQASWVVVSFYEESDSEESEKSRIDHQRVIPSSDTTSTRTSCWTNEENLPDLTFQSSWTTASINTPEFLMEEEDDLSLESLPVAAKLATRDVWNCWVPTRCQP